MVFPFRLGLPDPPTASNPGAWTIRQAIIDNVVATLEAVRSGNSCQSDEDNTSQEVSVSASGTYTGTKYRKYRVEVVTSGVSGVAEVTATDTTEGDDSGPVAAVVTSGVAVSLGTLGISITMTFAGTLQAGDVWYVEASTYKSDIRKIYRTENVSPNSSPNTVWGILRKPVETVEDGPIGKTTKVLELTISVYLNRVTDPDLQAEYLMGDCEKALMADHTRAGYAIDTEMTVNTAFVRDQIAAHGGFDLEFEVQYRHKRGDPYTL